MIPEDSNVKELCGRIPPGGVCVCFLSPATPPNRGGGIRVSTDKILEEEREGREGREGRGRATHRLTK